MTEVYPRRLVAARYDVKEEWTRALIDAFGPGGLLACDAPEFGREHLLWALVQLRHTNGRTGQMFTGDTTIAEELGYKTNDHPGKRCRDVLTRFGFFTQQGKQGRAANLLLSAPVAILDDYETLGASAHGEVITVADTKPSRTRKKADPKNGASRPAEPTATGSVEACAAHPEGDCPDPTDPFNSLPPWGPVVCRAALGA